MQELPGAVFIVDPRKEKIAVAEARKLEIPIVSIVDTNCDPDEVDFIIPGNDDAIRAVKLITSKIADAVLEGKQGLQIAQQEKEEETEAEDEKNDAVVETAEVSEQIATDGNGNNEGELNISTPSQE